jgi:hypothetical protein
MSSDRRRYADIPWPEPVCSDVAFDAGTAFVTNVQPDAAVGATFDVLPTALKETAIADRCCRILPFLIAISHAAPAFAKSWCSNPRGAVIIEQPTQSGSTYASGDYQHFCLSTICKRESSS